MLPRLIAALRRGGCDAVLLLLSPAAQEAIASRGDSHADQEILHLGLAQERTGTIQSGLAALPTQTEAVLIHPCDVPLLQAPVVQKLIAAWRGLPTPASQMVRPKTPAGRGGHPLVIGQALIAEILALSPSQPLRDFVHREPDRCLDVTIRGDPGPFLDVNTPEQLALIEGLLQPETD